MIENEFYESGKAAHARGQSWLTHPEGRGSTAWLEGYYEAQKEFELKHTPVSSTVNVKRSDVERLETIERAAKRLAYIVRKSVNSGPLSKDPTQEAEAWISLRSALGEGYDERGNLVPLPSPPPPHLKTEEGNTR